jgi:hypothetical protein
MNSTASTPSRPTATDTFEEVAPVFASGRVAGPSPYLLLAPWLLLVLLVIPPAAVLLTLLVVLALPFVAAGLAVAVVASPFLLVRALRRHLAERRQTSEGSEPIASGVAAFAHQRQ